jgi:type IV secretion system pilin
MPSYSKKILLYFIVVFFIFMPLFHTNAQTEALKSAQQGLIDTASDAQLTSDATIEDVNKNEITDIISKIIGYILAMLGVILLVQIIFAGYSWMMSGGNEESIKKAKDKIVSSIIGLVIIMAAYILVSAIFGLLVEATQTPPT